MKRRAFIKGLTATVASVYAMLQVGCSSLFKKDSSRAIASFEEGVGLPIGKWSKANYDAFRSSSANFQTYNLPQFDSHTQQQNETEINSFMSWSKKQMLLEPKDAKKKAIWQKDLEHKGRNLFGKLLSLNDQEMDYMAQTGIMSSFGVFLETIQTRKPSFGAADSFQAGRNAATASTIQLLGGNKIAQHQDAIFGYSMLYPYTDNYLDTTATSKTEKMLFAKKFRNRLQGKSETAKGPMESAIFEMVGHVESVYPRAQYPELYNSMVGIHDMQVLSLHQQEVPQQDFDILQMSVNKGGASVLADAFLTFGKPNPALSEFCFQYGFALQLMDDLQDVKKDASSGNKTVFTTAINDGQKLDELACKTMNFWMSTVESAKRVSAANSDDSKTLTDIIARGGMYFMSEAVADNADYYSDDFKNKLSKVMPLGMTATSKLNIEKKFVLEYRENPKKTVHMLKTFGKKI